MGLLVNLNGLSYVIEINKQEKLCNVNKNSIWIGITKLTGNLVSWDKRVKEWLDVGSNDI